MGYHVCRLRSHALLGREVNPVWAVEFTEAFEAWFRVQEASSKQKIVAAVQVLEERGPALGRPLVDTLKRSMFANMKELRPRGGNIRIIFAFDSLRNAILLIGGDKTNRWTEWCDENIPVADELFRVHLEAIKKKGSSP
jgi:hypothetical protein